MKSQHDPRRLNVVAFAADGAELKGQWPLETLPRLAADRPEHARTAPADVVWSARGRQRSVGGAPEPGLRLRARIEMPLECQRCLQPVTLPLVVDRAFRFVPGEKEAAELDADSEDDVLALGGPLDLLELLEDELLLALPLVALHERCPAPLPMAFEFDAEAPSATPAHPFAALAALKRDVG